MFEKRRGTTDEGKDFEDLYVANLVLDLITRPRITNFKVAANHSRFGAYDDVVCDLDSPNPQLAGKAALQLKYSNTGGQITPTKLNSWDKNCGLLRYFDEYVKVCDDLGTCQYFLVTNRKFAPTDFSLVDGKSGVDFDMTVTTADTENRRFRFTIRGSKNTNVDVPLLQKYQRFFDNFTLIANYDSVSVLREKIDQKFRSLFACQDDSVCKRYVDFVQSWSLKPGKKTVLHSSLMKHVIGLMVLSPSAEFFSPKRGQIDEKYDYLRDAVSKFDITLLAEDKSDKIKKLWNGVRDDLDRDYLRKAKIFGIMRLGVSSFDDLNDEEYTKLLWLMDECPLIVKDGEGVQKAIRLCKNRKFIVLTKKRSASEFRTFHRLSDLKKVDQVLYGQIVSTFTCSLQGKEEISLVELMDQKEKIAEVFRVDELVEMLDEPLLIGEPQEALPVSYIPRSLSRIVVDDSFLRRVDFRQTVVILVEVDDDRAITKRYNFSGSVHTVEEYLDLKEQTIDREECMVIDEDDIDVEDFKAICEKTTKTCHQFRLVYIDDDESWEWVRSSNNSHHLTPFLRNDVVTTESELLNNEDNRVNLVCGDPGMGKTTLMKDLKNLSCASVWSILIYARDHSKHFREAGDDSDKFKKYILDVTRKRSQDFEVKLIDILVREGRVWYFWDGLDEISRSNFETVKTIVEKLAKSKSKHWITSRCNLQRDLERRFNVVSRSIKEFDEAEQRRYIKTRLECSGDKLDDIYTKMKTSIQLFPYNDILGIPLQIYILTELFRGDEDKYSALLTDILSIADLYEHFVDKIFTRYFTEKENADVSNDYTRRRIKNQKQQQSEYYGRVSLKLYFEDDVLQSLGAGVAASKDKDQVGFITKISEDDRPEFFHNSFGEYFAALYLANHHDKVSSIKDFVFDKKYNNLRFFFDLILAKKCPLHVAVLYKNLSLLEKCTQEEFSKRDNMNRSGLEVACSWSESYQILDVTEKDGQFFVDNTAVRSSDRPTTRDIVVFLLKKCDQDEIITVLHNDWVFFNGASIKLVPFVLLTARTSTRTRLFDDHVLTILEYCLAFDYTDLLDLCDELWLMKDLYGNSIVYQSVEYGSKDIITTIAADPQTRRYLTDCQENLIHRACANYDYEMVEVLLTSGAKFSRNTNLVSCYCRTLLHKACLECDYDQAKLLIQAKTPINALEFINSPYCTFKTPLHCACFAGDPNFIRLLLDHEADFYTPDRQGRSPIYEACQSARFDIVELFLEKGAKLDFSRRNGKKLIHLACDFGELNIVKFLFVKQSQAILDSPDFFGRTPVHYCCRKRSFPILQFLVEKGAKLDVPDKEHGTPMHYACAKLNYQAVELFLEKGVSLDCVDKKGDTPLHRACTKYNPSVVNLLLRRVSYVNTRNKRGERPIHKACKVGNPYFVQLLLAHGAVGITQDNESPSLLKCLEQRLDPNRFEPQYYPKKVKPRGVLDKKGAKILRLLKVGDTPLCSLMSLMHTNRHFWILEWTIELNKAVALANELFHVLLRLVSEDRNDDVLKLLITTWKCVKFKCKYNQIDLWMSYEDKDNERVVLWLIVEKRRQENIADLCKKWLGEYKMNSYKSNVAVLVEIVKCLCTSSK